VSRGVVTVAVYQVGTAGRPAQFVSHLNASNVHQTGIVVVNLDRQSPSAKGSPLREENAERTPAACFVPHVGNARDPVRSVSHSNASNVNQTVIVVIHLDRQSPSAKGSPLRKENAERTPAAWLVFRAMSAKDPVRSVSHINASNVNQTHIVGQHLDPVSLSVKGYPSRKENAERIPAVWPVFRAMSAKGPVRFVLHLNASNVNPTHIVEPHLDPLSLTVKRSPLRKENAERTPAACFVPHVGNARENVENVAHLNVKRAVGDAFQETVW